MRKNVFLFVLLYFVGLMAVAQDIRTNMGELNTGFGCGPYLIPDGEERHPTDLPKHGTIRALILFAQLKGDETPCSDWENWKTPRNAATYVDLKVQKEAAMYETFFSHYFKEASFGKLDIIADYVGDVFEIDSFSSLNIRRRLDAFFADKKSFLTANGYLYPRDFDNWTYNGKNKEMTMGEDGVIDQIIIFVRKNEKYRGSGFSFQHNINGKERTCISVISDESRYGQVAVHEVNHFFIGGNDYHSGGPNTGVGWFASEINGYSGLSNCYHSILLFCNAWDRYKVGWFPSFKKYDIQAQNKSGVLVDADLDYFKSFPNGTREFILRPTPIFGDAVRIKLPYVGGGKIPPQYIWLENHQLESSTIDGRYKFTEADNIKPKGIYINYQNGAEQSLYTYDRIRNNSISAISSYGAFDYDVVFSQSNEICNLYATRDMGNPLSGHDLFMSVLSDLNGDEEIKREDESFMLYGVFMDGKEMSKDECNDFPFNGNKYQSFRKGDKAYIGGNPSLSTKLTWVQDSLRLVIGGPPKRVAEDASKNRKIYLNGLSVEVADEFEDGSVLIRVRNNDYSVDNHLRWCGNIVLNEKVIIEPGYTIKLDRGLTPTKCYIDTILFNGQALFSDVTKFTMNPNSVFDVGTDAVLEVTGESALVLEVNSTLNLADNAKLIIRKGSTLHLKENALLACGGKAEVVVEKGAYVCVHPNAMISLKDSETMIRCYEGYLAGIGYRGVPDSLLTCMDIMDKSVVGAGKIILVPDELYIQNENISSKAAYGVSVYVGDAVTNAKPKGAVTVEDYGNLKIRYDNEAVLDRGFIMEGNATLDVDRNDEQ